jgi:hypothetical protein
LELDCAACPEVHPWSSTNPILTNTPASCLLSAVPALVVAER